jgi:hypothetical protein
VAKACLLGTTCHQVLIGGRLEAQHFKVLQTQWLNSGVVMNNKLNAKERLHLARVKELPCSVCDAPGPSDAHHVKQGLQYTCVALCKDCHQGSFLGWHGQKRAWSIRKMDEIDALNKTIERLINELR